MHEVLLKHRGRYKYPGSRPRACEGVKVVSSFNIMRILDEKESVAETRFEKALSAVPNKPFQGIAGKEVNSVVTEGQEIVRSTAVGLEEEKKGCTIDSRRLQSDIDTHAHICESHKARAAWRSEVQPVIADALTDVANGRKGVASEVSMVMGLPRIGMVLLVSHMRLFSTTALGSSDW